MIKVKYIVLSVLLLISCRPKQDEVEIIIEDGVEVVLNHLEPCQLKGAPTVLQLEDEFSIDSERDEIAKVGLSNIWHWFDVDSEGNIYLIDFRGKN